MLFLACCALQSATAQVPITTPSQSEIGSGAITFYSNPRGKWQSLQWNLDMWVLDLKVTGTTLTGTVSVTPGPGRESMIDSRSVDIYDGKIDNNNRSRIEFKVKSPDNTRVITFSSMANGSALQFTRKVEMLPGASPGGDDIFGAAGPQTFVVKRLQIISSKAKYIDQ